MNWNRSGKLQADALTHNRYTYFVDESTTTPVLVGVTLGSSSGMKKHVRRATLLFPYAAVGRSSINGFGAAGIEEVQMIQVHCHS